VRISGKDDAGGILLINEGEGDGGGLGGKGNGFIGDGEGDFCCPARGSTFCKIAHLLGEYCDAGELGKSLKSRRRDIWSG
jgi:hypothetical protein